MARASNIVEYGELWRGAHPGSALGTVDRSAVHAVIRGQAAQIRTCYEGALGKLHDFRGRVIARFVIDASGKVPTASVQSGELQQAPELGCCLVKRIAQWSFPAPVAGDYVVIEYPFVVSISGGR
jgi:hypothetical protein